MNSEILLYGDVQTPIIFWEEQEMQKMVEGLLYCIRREIFTLKWMV